MRKSKGGEGEVREVDGQTVAVVGRMATVAVRKEPLY